MGVHEEHASRITQINASRRSSVGDIIFKGARMWTKGANFWIKGARGVSGTLGTLGTLPGQFATTACLTDWKLFTDPRL